MLLQDIFKGAEASTGESKEEEDDDDEDDDFEDDYDIEEVLRVHEMKGGKIIGGGTGEFSVSIGRFGWVESNAP